MASNPHRKEAKMTDKNVAFWYIEKNRKMKY